MEEQLIMPLEERDPEFKVGDPVYFTESRFEDKDMFSEFGQYIYRRGDQGKIVDIYPQTKWLEWGDPYSEELHLFYDKLGGDVNQLDDQILYKVSIHGSLFETYLVPESVLLLDSESQNQIIKDAEDVLNKAKQKLDLHERVENRLVEKQANKAIKDVGTRVASSRKEKAAWRVITMQDMEAVEEQGLAYELINKDKLYPKVEPEVEREAGISSTVAYLKSEIRKAITPKPANTPEARKCYIFFIEKLISELSKVTKTEQIEDIMTDIWKNFARYCITAIEGYTEYQIKEIVLSKMKPTGSSESTFNSYYYSNITPYEVEYPRTAKYFMRLAYNSEAGEIQDHTNRNSLFQRNPYMVDFKELIGEVLGNKFYLFNRDLVGIIRAAKFACDAMSETESVKEINYHINGIPTQVIKLDAELALIPDLFASPDCDVFMKNAMYGMSFLVYGNQVGWSGKKLNAHCSYKDLVNITEKLKFIDLYKGYISERVGELKKQIEAAEFKYRVKDEDWSWAFQKDVERELSGEIKINEGMPLKYVKRTGGTKILESDYLNEDGSVKTDFFLNYIGIRGITFGNYVKDTEAKAFLDNFVPAIIDLADILNVSIASLCHLQNLAFALGALGGGRALATYHPSKKAINLTKRRGDGTVAHEFGHYIDNCLYLYDRGRDAVKEPYGSSVLQVRSAVTSPIVDPYIAQKMEKIFELIFFSKHVYTPQQIQEIGHIPMPERKDVIYAQTKKAWRSIVPADITTIEDWIAYYKKQHAWIFTEEGLKGRNSRALLGYVVSKFGLEKYAFNIAIKSSIYYAKSLSMKSDYWVDNAELFARAFETYIFDKLAKAGRENNFLVSGAYFDNVSGVYPAGIERERLFALYDDLFSTIKSQLKLPDFVPIRTERVDTFVDISTNVIKSKVRQLTSLLSK